MKTFAKTMTMAAVALIGSTAMAQVPQYRGALSGACPNGRCTAATAACVNGSCGVAGCPDGKCGPAGCPNGACTVGSAGSRYGVATAYPAPARPRNAALTYPVSTAGYRAGAGCPGGNCARPAAVSHTAAYRPATMNSCPNGQCTMAPAARRPVQPATRFNLLGWTR